METVYKLRPKLRFHDGTPITADDFAFGFEVRTNPMVPAPGADVETFVAAVRPVDAATMVIEWKQTYIWAAQIIGPSFSPMPRHLLADLYRSDLNAFVNGPHWREEFIGSGPYRLERWEPGVLMVLRAFDGFVFGKPPIDQITMRFIRDANVVVANLLSGSVDMAYSATIAYPQGETLQQQGWAGNVDYSPGIPRYVHFQMRDWGNTQLAVQDVRLRRAMLHAIDRQSIVDTIYAGQARPLHVWVYPADPSFDVVDRAVTKYAFDMNWAQALLQEAGWRRSGDGGLRNAAGDALDMYVLAHSGRVEEQEAEVIASAWRSLGMSVDMTWLTAAQMSDGEYRSKFRAVTYDRRPLDNMVWTSENLSGPENRWRLGNRNGYVNPRLDDLWHRVMTTVALREREPLLVEAMKVMTEDAAVVPTHLQPRVIAYPSGMTGVKPPQTGTYIMSPWEWHWR
jgi:peptide/nickel transport system substrate-binding protein